MVHQAVLAAREAHQALLNLKQLAEAAADELHNAELQAVGFAVSSFGQDKPLGTLREAALRLQSLAIETAVAEARAKTERVLQAAAA